ncbi:hypothetical protein [Rhodopseudomonas telluris]|uniref:DUF2946 domain-containing protein n=1 Tax=Rhodopseudomonas telluris TaxID=644215 RepID=A0ABV6EUZ2_9BRAD
MNWVRAKIGLGARLALIALAIQFVASFGHFDALATPPAQIDAAQLDPALIASTADSAPTDHDHDRTADLCAICAVHAMANAMLDASPPSLPLQVGHGLRYRFAGFAAAEPGQQPGGFQPRAPPLS